jgi:3-oxoacyl-[acyl-carrier protein] reductase
VSRTDPVAIVTGDWSGAGREVARALARHGCAVVVVYLRDRTAAEAVIDAIGAADGTAIAVRAAVADELDVERLFDETAAAFGGVDLIVHTASRATTVLDRQAARRLRHGGAIVGTGGSLAPALAAALRARGVTVDGVAPGTRPAPVPRASEEIVRLVDRWRAGA